MVSILGYKYTFKHRRVGGTDVYVGAARSGETIDTTTLSVADDGTVEIDRDSLHIPSGRVQVTMSARYTGAEGAAEADHCLREMRYRHARR